MNPCPSCASVHFVSRRVHRRGSLVVFLGHSLLVPAILATVLGTMGVVRPGSDARDLEQRATAELDEARVPAAIAARVSAHESLGEAEMAALTADQQQGVRRAQVSAADGSARAAMGEVVSAPAFRWFVGLAISCGIAGLVLVQKVSIRCCANCGTGSR